MYTRAIWQQKGHLGQKLVISPELWRFKYEKRKSVEREKLKIKQK
jgi:hypothetical protein